MRKKFLNISVIIISLIAGIYIGIRLERITNPGLTKIRDAIKYTKDYYIDSVEYNKLVEDAIKGIFNELDPHTTYIPLQDQQSSEEEFQGYFEGIGIEFQIIKDTIVVVSPISNGPSEEVGIISGDRIIKIDGEDCIGFTNELVIKKLKGKKGTKVNITILRPSTQKTISFTITRDTINLFSVDVSFMYDQKTGYINLSRFSDTSTDELISSLKKLSDNGMKQLILDLRNNPGGYLNQAHQIADLFIDEDKLIVYTEGRVNEANEKFFARKSYPYENLPLIILVNRGSASASEIVAGAIQDWDRGLIVGETTFGKGLVQRAFLLNDNSAVRITVAKYYTPSGREIQRRYENKENYYEEILERQVSDLDNYNHKYETDSSNIKYRTMGGREVVGNGGITPDYIVEYSKDSNYSIELRKNNIYYQFVRRYLDIHGDQLRERYKDNLNLFVDEFNLDEAKLKDFINYATSQNVNYAHEDFIKDKDKIIQRLKAFIARDLFNDIGWYTVLLGTDRQFQKAIELFEKDDAYINSKMK